MKTFKHLLFALIASLLLTAGLAKAAAPFDSVRASTQMERVDGGPPSLPCIIEN